MTIQHSSIVERLRALVIMDEVGSDNPLGREAADLIDTLQAENARLAARIEELERERDEARAANEHDRTVVIDARNAIHDAIQRRSWLLGRARGSYEWDDERFYDEFAAAIDEIEKPLAILEKIGADWSHCPTDEASIQMARSGRRARAALGKEAG